MDRAAFFFFVLSSGFSASRAGHGFVDLAPRVEVEGSCLSVHGFIFWAKKGPALGGGHAPIV